MSKASSPGKSQEKPPQQNKAVTHNKDRHSNDSAPHTHLPTFQLVNFSSGCRPSSKGGWRPGLNGIISLVNGALTQKVLTDSQIPHSTQRGGGAPSLSFWSVLFVWPADGVWWAGPCMYLLKTLFVWPAVTREMNQQHQWRRCPLPRAAAASPKMRYFNELYVSIFPCKTPCLNWNNLKIACVFSIKESR